MTYDALGNERHKAVCELRKLPDGYPDYLAFPFAKWYEDLSTALGIGKGEVSCAKVRDTLIHLLGGDQVPVTLGDMYGIWKGDGDVDAGRRDETGGGRSDAAADGHMADCAGNQLAEGVAPITGELRKWWVIKFPVMDEEQHRDFTTICDRIDAVHAGLERENAELRERVAVLDESADSMRETDAWKLGYDEGFASADDWMADNEDAMEEHGWIRLPMDADGVPFHVGELVDEMLPFGGYAAPAPIDTMELSRGASGYGWMVKLDAKNRASISPSLLRHHRAPTVEDVLREMHAELDEVTALYVGEAIDSDERDRDEARIIAEYSAKLRLAGDAE